MTKHIPVPFRALVVLAGILIGPSVQAASPEALLIASAPNSTPSGFVWKKPWHLPAVIAVCLLEVYLIVSLVLHWRRRTTVESDLHENEELMRMAASAGKLALWTWEIASDHVWMTDEGRAMLGWSASEPINFERFRKTLYPGDRRQADRALQAALNGGGSYEGEYRVAFRDGAFHWVRVVGEVESKNGKALRMRGVLIDVTAHRETQFESEQRRQELLHLSRAEILGQLSGSLAHELNQPLSAMLTNTQVMIKLINRAQVDPKELLEILNDLVADNRRANEIVMRLRGWLKKEKRFFEEHDLNAIIDDVIRLLKSELMFHRVSCTLDLSPDRPMVLCDRVQIQQVMVNLIKNAWEGLQSNSDGERAIVIRTGAHESGQWVVSVNNNGELIPSRVMKELFKPFLSTKPTGLGMGLSICQAIVENHKGKIWADNTNKFAGPTFYFTLPSATGERQAVGAVSSRMRPRSN